MIDQKSQKSKIKNEYSYRVIKLQERDYRILQIYMNEIRNEIPSQILFTSLKPPYSALSYASVKKIFDQVDLSLKALLPECFDTSAYDSIERLTPHVCRHSWAYMMLSFSFEKYKKENVSHSEFIIFHDADLRLIESLHLPTVIRFHRADKFDSKFVQTSNDVWNFSYSGKKLHLNFSNFSTPEKKLAKFFLASYIQVNTPSALESKLQSYTFAIKSLKLET